VSLPEIAHLAKSIELRINEALWAVLPGELAEKRKLESFRVGGAFITLAPKSTSLQQNRVRGLGVEEAAIEAMVDEIVHLFRSRGIKRFSFHLSPCPQSELITEWLKARGLKLHHQYSKLVRDTAPPARMATEFKIKRVERLTPPPLPRCSVGSSPGLRSASLGLLPRSGRPGSATIWRWTAIAPWPPD
jgi:hypothetical protein